MNRREFTQCLLSAAAAPAWGLARREEDEGRSREKLSSFHYEDVTLLDGPLLEQFRATRDVYFNIPNESMLFGFRQRAGMSAPGKSLGGWYGNDIFNTFGQFIAGMTRLARGSNDTALRDKANELIEEWAKTIAPDGYFFYSKKPNAYHYFYEKMMGGLNDAYEFSGNKDAREHAERITAWAMKNLDRARTNPTPGNAVGADHKGNNEWYTLGENLYRFYEFTGEPKYRDFAQVWQYDKYWNGFAENKPDVDELHAYSHVNTLSSAAMAYRVTGNPVFLKTLTNAHAYLQATQVFATGGYGPGERLLRPDGRLGASLDNEIRSFETPCGSWGGFKMSHYLLTFTGECRYGDWLETLMYNGIGAALPVLPNGDTFYYADYRTSGGVKFYHWSAWPCCSGTYPQAVADYVNSIYFRNDDGLYVNLYVPSEVKWQPKNGAGAVSVRQTGDYPKSSKVSFTISLHGSMEFPLSFRIPAWASSGATLSVNGKAQSVPINAGQWATLKRRWQNGDRVELELPLQPRMQAIDPQHPNRVAVLRGPTALVLNAGNANRQDLSGWKSGLHGAFSAKAQHQIEDRFTTFWEMGSSKPYIMYFDLPVSAPGPPAA